jgi:hypothetical protein
MGTTPATNCDMLLASFTDTLIQHHNNLSRSQSQSLQVIEVFVTVVEVHNCRHTFN